MPAPTPATAQPTSAASGQATAAPSAGLISRDDAIQAALARVPGAGISDVTKCKLDRDDGRMIYEIEIRYGGAEYEIDVDASTGAVIDFDVD